MFRICLIGNPNCGKTTLFNSLTGSYEKVGNRAGVTVEVKRATLKGDKDVTVIDLPGLYSLSADTEDELSVLKFLKAGEFDTIINVIDGTNLDKSLFLTAELTELSAPMVIAVNFCDELDKNGVKLNTESLLKAFNVPVIKISARKGDNVKTLISVAKESTKIPKPIPKENVSEFVKRIKENTVQGKVISSEIFTDKADKYLTGRFWGIMTLAVTLFSVFFITFKLGGWLSGVIGGGVENLSGQSYSFIIGKGGAVWFADLICNAVIAGLGNVLSFLPQIIILFFMLTALEQTGYTSRVAFLLDEPLNRIGLCGKSFFSLGLSCGCAVNGISSVAIIEEKKKRNLTVFLSPLMPCGAKTAVFAYLCGKLFNGNALIAVSFYFLSTITVFIAGKMLSKLKAFNVKGGTVIELPTFRSPSLRVLYGAVRDKTLDFILKAGTVIFAVSIILWGLKNFGFSGYIGENSELSFLYLLGNALKYLFYPLGFGNWQATVAVISGIFAKEAVIESLSAVGGDVSSLFYNGYSAYAFMAFILFSPPCIAALSSAKRRLKNGKLFLFMLAFQTLTGYLIALIINVFGIVAENAGEFTAFILTLMLAAVIICLKKFFNARCCGDCKRCLKEKENCRIKAN